MKESISNQATILVVDDDLDLLEIIKDSIEDYFEKVITIDSAIKAFDVLKTNSIDCIVTDYRMPQMDGLQFIDELKKTHPQIPVILLTGNGSNPEVLEAVEKGVFDYLDKPFRAQVLVNRIRNALLLPRLESLIMDMARSEFPDLKFQNLLAQNPEDRLNVIGKLEAMIRMRLMAKTKPRTA